jgi:DNA-binding CsgD family transcriptional regulator/signal transduction protein with GAF and PtsI domain
MAEYIPEAIQQSNESLLQLNRELDFLCRAGQVINSSLNLKQVLTAFIKEVRRLMGVVGCSVWLISKDKKEVVCLQATGKKSDLVRGWRLPVGKGVVGWIAKNGESVLIKDTREDNRHYKKVDSQTGLEIRSIIGVPIHFEEKTVGVLQLVDTVPDRFKRHQLKLMAGLAASAGVAISNAMLFDRTHQEIAVRKRAEKKLRKSKKELVIKSQNLEELNTALKVLLQKRGEDKKQMEEQVLLNTRKLIDPYLKKLHQSGLNRDQSALLEILENNMEEIVSPFTYRLSLEHFDITRREFDIANLVHQGRRNREIAEFLGITRRTVETHRRNLRVKLGIDNRKINLRVHLMTMALENT